MITYLLELAIALREQDFPPIVNDLMHDRFHVRFFQLHGFQVHIDVLFKIFDWDQFVVQVYVDMFDAAGQIVNSFFKQRLQVIVDTRHAKLSEIGFESDFRILFSGLAEILELRLGLFRHILGEDLFKDFPRFSVCGFHDKFVTEDITQFGPITVATAGHFLLGVIVI